MKALPVFVVVLLLARAAPALEPVSALNDAFAVPAGVGLIEAVHSFPGAEAFIQGMYVGGAWQVPYGVDELTVTTGLAGYTRGRIGLSAAYNGSGFELYGEEQEKIGFSYAPSLYGAAGVRITRNAMRIKGFGDASALSCDVGVVLKPCETVYLAAAVEDVTGAELGAAREPLDGRLLFAVSWKTPAQVYLIASAVKVRRFDPSFAFGMVMEVGSILMLGVSGANEPDRFDFLCGVQAKGGLFSWRGTYHRELGMSHGFSICWSPSFTASRDLPE